jgi:DNA-directed RNA polymerase specialized sigma24 family protein
LTGIDELFARVCLGDEAAFERWMTGVEPQLRRSLAPWARAVDVEGVVQETLLRMWVLAGDRGQELEGPRASLRFALGIARNLARNEARRLGREVELPEGLWGDAGGGGGAGGAGGVAGGGADGLHGDAPPLPDPALRRIILACIERLPPRPRAALLARIDRGHEEDDHALSEGVGMKRNTFLQNIVRARRALAACLEASGAPLDEVMP